MSSVLILYIIYDFTHKIQLSVLIYATAFVMNLV